MSKTTIMQSPAQTTLPLVLFKTKEGIERRGVTTYEGVLTFAELAAHFEVEANADILPEAQKRQRDVDSSRINGLKRYWDTSEGTVFPSITIFVSDLQVTREIQVGSRTLVEAELAADADRFLCDGQGRTTLIKHLMSTAPEAGTHTIACKLIVTHSEDLSVEPASVIIKQCFSDYHAKVKVPSKSLSKHFDSSTPVARLFNELLEIRVGTDQTLLRDRIGLHGKIRFGTWCTFEQFSQMITRLLGSAQSVLNKQLADQQVYDQSFALCEGFLTRLGELLPFTELDTEQYLARHEQLMWTKAIFVSALGYVGKSLVEEMVADGQFSWERFKTLQMPIASKDDKYWASHKVTLHDGDRVTIIKGTDRRIGALICRELRVLPCEELMV